VRTEGGQRLQPGFVDGFLLDDANLPAGNGAGQGAFGDMIILSREFGA